MQEKQTMDVKTRNFKYKRELKTSRKEGFIPAVIYGKHMEQPLNILVNKKDFEQKLKGLAGLNTIFELKLDNSQKNEMVIIHEFQIDPLTDQYLHIDFHQVNTKEKINAHIPLKLIGTAKGVKMGGNLMDLLDSIDVRCLPFDLLPFLEVEISELNIGDSISIKDLKLPNNIEIINDADQKVVIIEGANLASEEEEASASTSTEAETATTTA